MSRSGEVSGRDRELIALGALAAAVTVFYLARLVAGGEPMAAGGEPPVRVGGPSAGAPARPLDRVLIPAAAAGMLAAGSLLMRCMTYRPACRMAALAAFSHAVTVAVRPFSAESVVSHAVAQSGNFTPILLVLAVLALPQRRWPGRARTAAAAAGIGFAGLTTAVRVAAFPAAADGDPVWLARHELAGAAAAGGAAVAVAAAVTLLAAAYRSPHASGGRETVLWTIGGALASLPAWLLLRLPAYAVDRGAEGAAGSAGAVADLLLLPLPIFFLVGAQRIRSVDQRRAANRFVATLVVVAALFLFVMIAGDSPQRQIAASYGLTDRVAGFLVLAPVFVALFALHAVLVRAFDRAGGAGRAPAPPGGADGSRGVRDVRMLARSLHRSLGGSLSGAAGSLQALESELESERDRSPQAGAAPRQLPRDALDSIRGFRQTALTVLAALRRLDAGTRSGSAVVAVQVSDLFAAAYRRAARSADLRAVLTDGGGLFVACDPAEMARAVAELLLNAEEAGLRPRARIVMRARARGGHVVIEVEDSGARPLGPARSRVFEPFYSTKPGHDGLGLYISRALIEHNGGSLVLERGAQGTCAVVTLPAAGP